jgi:hypothetical protein
MIKQASVKAVVVCHAPGLSRCAAGASKNEPPGLCGEDVETIMATIFDGIAAALTRGDRVQGAALAPLPSGGATHAMASRFRWRRNRFPSSRRENNRGSAWTPCRGKPIAAGGPVDRDAPELRHRLAVLRIGRGRSLKAAEVGFQPGQVGVAEVRPEPEFRT